MQIYDMHIHTNGTGLNREKLLGEMESAGVYGGCLFSPCPYENDPVNGIPFKERLDYILAAVKGYEDRLFPVLWIHPYEENIIENVKLAASEGVAGFKIICNNFYPSDDKCMMVLHEIASLDLPVFFHSGILYSNGVSFSEYSRPINFECLESIPALRFSMGHCGWPWIDECLALYGRMSYNNWIAKGDDRPAEMFLDLTPGAPAVQREELFTKYYLFAQDTTDNILFGIDQVAENYRKDSTANWINFDRKIYEKLGIREEVIRKTYKDNLMRFLGKKEYKESFVRRTWGTNPYSKTSAEIIEKWYKKLEFPKDYDNEFYNALNKYHISDAISIETYDLSETDGKRNLLSFLFMCEKLAKDYKKRGIPEDVLIDTLRDVVLWTNAWSEVKGELFLGELPWLSNSFKFKLFRLGSLEFMAGKSKYECEEIGLNVGNDIIEVHIPSGADLSEEEVKNSFDKAKSFFKKLYPEERFTHFICDSWLLDPTLEGFLSSDSKIIKFKNNFTHIESTESYAALRYIFTWNTTRQNLKNATVFSSLSNKIKAHVLKGGALNESCGAFKIEY